MNVKKLLFFSVLLCVITESVRPQDEEPASRSDVEELRGTVEALNESAAEYRGYVDFLRKIKVTGYVQAQVRVTDLNGAAARFSGGDFPTGANKHFQVRRGRLKVTYDNVLTQFVVQLDATQAGIALKDCYLSLTEPWLQSFGFQMGVFDRPFGYEISFSSSGRESPERSRVYQTLFPGERELGAKLLYAPQLGSMSFLRADLGLFNGSGPTSNEFDSFKDVIGHLAVQVPFEEAGAEIDLGISGYFGKVRNNTKYLWSDGEAAPGVRGLVVDSALSNQGDGVLRRYAGADVQFYYDVPVLGGMALRGEVIVGKQPGTSNAASPAGMSGTSLTTVSPSAQPTGPIYQRDFTGWYLNLVQNIGSSEQVVLKYDVYDPNSKVSGSDFGGQSNLTAADIRFSTLGFGFVHHWDENVKFVVYYEVVRNEKLNPAASTVPSLSAFIDDVRDNVFTFRVQYKF